MWKRPSSWFRATEILRHGSSPRGLRAADARARRMSGARRSSRAIPTIRLASVRPMPSPRRRSSGSTIPTVRARRATSGGRPLGLRSTRPWRPGRPPRCDRGLGIPASDRRRRPRQRSAADHGADARWPHARWHIHEPVTEDLRLEAASIVFGRTLEPRLRFDRAEAVVSLDDDFLGPGPRQTLYAPPLDEAPSGGAARGRRLSALYGGADPLADRRHGHRRLIVGPRELSVLAEALVSALATRPHPSARPRKPPGSTPPPQALKRHAGRALVTVGAQHDPPLQAAGPRLNAQLGTSATTSGLCEPRRLLRRTAGYVRRAGRSRCREAAYGRLRSSTGIRFTPRRPTSASARRSSGSRRGSTPGSTSTRPPRNRTGMRRCSTTSRAGATPVRADGLATILQPLVRPFRDGARGMRFCTTASAM